MIVVTTRDMLLGTEEAWNWIFDGTTAGGGIGGSTSDIYEIRNEWFFYTICIFCCYIMFMAILATLVAF